MAAHPPILSPDSPLSHPDDDELEYAAFAELMARAIINMVPAEGLVMALNGPWGAGKSTVLNFIMHYLNQSEADSRPIMVQFNPWWFSGREDLTRVLFGQIRAALGDTDYADVKAKLADLANLVSKLTLIPGAEALGLVADKLQAVTEISALKTAIGKLLLEKQRKILVIVDDIDRLSTTEIEDLFRTIKAVANLPNVIYLLAFDANIVVNALQGHYAQVGSDYIEKIVQVPFVLPNPDKVALRRLLFGRLDRILGGTPDGLLDPNYWANVYFDGIDHYINTPRDVNRLINVLRVDYPALVGEVNPVDFIAIESIKVFSPKFYEIIRVNADSLCGVHLGGTSSKEKADEKATYDRWIEREPDMDRAGLRKLARRLFPRVGEAYGGSSSAPDSLSGWTKQMRVCSPEYFPVYFRFSLSPDSVSSAAMRSLLEKTSNSEDFTAALIAYSRELRRDGSTRLGVTLQRFEAHTPDVPADNIPNVVNSFFNVGDELLKKEDEPRGLFGFDNEMYMARIVHQLLTRLPQDQRFSILRDAIVGGNALSFIERQVAVLGQEHGKFGGEPRRPEAERTVKEDQLGHLEKIALRKIRDAAANGTLLNVHDLRSILDRWESWSGSPAEMREWVAAAITADEGLAIFINSFSNIQRSPTFGEYAVRKRFRLDPEWIKPFADPETLFLRVQRLLAQDGLTEDQMKAAAEFCREYEMRQRGENPDDHS